MKFLVDAQLPFRLAELLRLQGHDVVHTLELPAKNKTTDSVIRKLSLSQKRIVITKDSDFLDSYIIRQEPYKLLLITTGNIGNNELLKMVSANLNEITRFLKENHVVELSRSEITVHY